MVGNIGPIPGMYFDEEKGKYFKIQASGAGPASSAYSSNDVKRRELRAKKEGEAARVRERQRCRIKRSTILQKRLAGGLLQREYGRAGFEPGGVVARGLVRAGHLTISYDEADRVGTGVFTISHRPEIGPSTINIGYCSKVRSDFPHTFMDVRVDLEDDHPSSQNVFFRVKRISTEHIPCDPTNITSVSVHEPSQVRATTYLSQSELGAIRINAVSEVQTSGWFGDTHRQSITVAIDPGDSRGPGVSIFSSTPAPPVSDLLFAFGTSRGVLATSKARLGTCYVTARPPPGLRDDLFAVEILSDSPNTLLSGGRRGILNLTDLRAAIPPWDNDTITHPSSITHIRQIDANRIIVCGLQSSLCQYDLRFRKEDSKPAKWSLHQAHARNRNPSRSIVQYPDYHNTASHQAGFDIDPDSGIVAAAQEADDYHPSVQLFSLKTGHRFDSPHAFGFEFRDEKDWLVKCLRFARDSDSGRKSLYVGQRPLIQRYAWGDHDWKEESYGGDSRYARENDV
ncbi:uncharacterized protein RAG0_13781 [Rhynchosporium agropyri]|uniref:Myocyte-specific enhancer factor 2d n=1 Tax=Rhynchosporium agropyri TaxID=914238 RepID=A0A1E1LEI6_9HELO|nr:uncharacterized protein RAG0_13781 [Rhynchosporium agropyri]